MNEIHKIYSDLNIYDYASMYLEDNTKFFAEFFEEFNKVDWFVLFHVSTNNPFIYQNYKAIICLNQDDCIRVIKKYDLGDKIYFRRFGYDKKHLLEEFFRMGIKEIDIYIIDRFLQMSLLNYESRMSEKIIRQKGIFAELFQLIQTAINNANHEYDFSELKRMENRCYDKMLRTDFYCRTKISDNSITIEQLIDKVNKTVWFACYTELKGDVNDNGWQVNKMPLIDIINYVNNANGIIINPYEENIRLNNNIIAGIKKYIFRRKIIGELLHTGIIIPLNEDVGKLKTELFRIFSKHDNISRVYLSKIIKDNHEYYLLMLDMTDDDSSYFKQLSVPVNKVFGSNRIYLVKVWDIDELYIRQASLIYSRFS